MRKFPVPTEVVFERTQHRAAHFGYGDAGEAIAQGFAFTNSNSPRNCKLYGRRLMSRERPISGEALRDRLASVDRDREHRRGLSVGDEQTAARKVVLYRAERTWLSEGPTSSCNPVSGSILAPPANCSPGAASDKTACSSASSRAPAGRRARVQARSAQPCHLPSRFGGSLV